MMSDNLVTIDLFIAFFCFKQKTAYEMRISDWSSDVCSSDLARTQGLWHDPDNEPEYSQTLELDLGTLEPSIAGPKRPQDRIPVRVAPGAVGALLKGQPFDKAVLIDLDAASQDSFPAIGSASCRARACQYM